MYHNQNLRPGPGFPAKVESTCLLAVYLHAQIHTQFPLQISNELFHKHFKLCIQKSPYHSTCYLSPLSCVHTKNLRVGIKNALSSSILASKMTKKRRNNGHVIKGCGHAQLFHCTVSNVCLRTKPLRSSSFEK